MRRFTILSILLLTLLTVPSLTDDGDISEEGDGTGGSQANTTAVGTDATEGITTITVYEIFPPAG